MERSTPQRNCNIAQPLGEIIENKIPLVKSNLKSFTFEKTKKKIILLIQ